MNCPNIYIHMLNSTHLLIAGATGSGKSVIINGCIYAAMLQNGTDMGLILIDPKRVELSAYAKTKQCILHATEPAQMISALDQAMQITENRYRMMAKKGIKKLTTTPIYVVIDELADLMTTCRKDVLPIIQRICQVGRAANVHVIAATQCPLAKIIPTEIKVNFDYRVGLRMAQRQHSRNLLDENGCELLPLYGQCLYQTPEGTVKYIVPMVSDAEILTVCKYYKRHLFSRRVA